MHELSEMNIAKNCVNTNTIMDKKYDKYLKKNLIDDD